MSGGDTGRRDIRTNLWQRLRALRTESSARVTQPKHQFSPDLIWSAERFAPLKRNHFNPCLHLRSYRSFYSENSVDTGTLGHFPPCGAINHADLSDCGRRKKRVTLSVSDHARVLPSTFVEHTGSVKANIHHWSWK